MIKTEATLSEYLKRVQRFLTDNKHHLTIRRLRNNEPISRADLIALEEILFSHDGPLTKAEYLEIYGDRPYDQAHIDPAAANAHHKWRGAHWLNLCRSIEKL